jgi:hypothetical protein
MTASTLLHDDATTRAEWLHTIEQILGEIEHWAHDAGWLVSRSRRTIQEDSIGTYDAPILQVKTPPGNLIVEPIAYSIFSGVKGRIDLYAWPSMHRVRLVKVDDQWRVRTDSGINWPKPWGRETFLELANELTAAP